MPEMLVAIFKATQRRTKPAAWIFVALLIRAKQHQLLRWSKIDIVASSSSAAAFCWARMLVAISILQIGTMVADPPAGTSTMSVVHNLRREFAIL
jgi:hypothetical protein